MELVTVESWKELRIAFDFGSQDPMGPSRCHSSFNYCHVLHRCSFSLRASVNNESLPPASNYMICTALSNESQEVANVGVTVSPSSDGCAMFCTLGRIKTQEKKCGTVSPSHSDGSWSAHGNSEVTGQANSQLTINVVPNIYSETRR